MKHDIPCKVLNHDNSFSEFILLEIACKENTKLTLDARRVPVNDRIHKQGCCDLYCEYSYLIFRD